MVSLGIGEGEGLSAFRAANCFGLGIDDVAVAWPLTERFQAQALLHDIAVSQGKQEHFTRLRVRAQDLWMRCTFSIGKSSRCDCPSASHGDRG